MPKRASRRRPPGSAGLRRRAACVLACLWLAGLWLAGGALPARGELETRPLPLPGGPEALSRIGRLIFHGGLVLTDDRPGFGGFSGLEVSPDGRRLWALSDQGRLLTGRLRYDPGGRLIGLRDSRLTPLVDVDGRPVSGARRDAEGLARRPDGSFLVSHEWRHRVMLYPGDPARTAPVPLATPPETTRLADNMGVEAVAVLRDGRTLLLGETGLRGEIGAFPGWIDGPGGWQRLVYLAARGYRPTGAATLPDGDVVVIERRDPMLILTGGRVVLLPQSAVQGGRGIGGIELGRLVPPALNANYEGIAAWRDGSGRTRLLVISDNNFLSVQRTLLLQFLVN